MALLGNTPNVQSFTPAIDYFSGNGSTTSFTLSKVVGSSAQVQAVISNVPQNPGSAFTVNGNTITFTSAPPAGTNNIYVYYVTLNSQVMVPSPGSVGASQMVPGAAVANIGYAPVNKAGDTMSGALALPSGGLNVGSGQLSVDASGRVTQSSQPRFVAYGMGGATSYGDGADFVLAGVSTNVGSHYNPSNGRFTAPVPGFYLFTYGTYSNSAAHIAIHKNGSVIAPVGSDAQGIVSMVVAEARGASIGLNLSANDYVSFGWRNGFSGAIYLSHSWFTGVLIG